MKALHSYRIAPGANVALASLVNVEQIPQLARPPSNVIPIDPFPIRTQMLSNNTYGDGALSHEWPFDSLLITGLNYIISQYLTTGGVVVASKAVTIYTNLRDRAYYARFTGSLEYPVPDQDYKLDGLYCRNLKLRFNGLVMLA